MQNDTCPRCNLSINHPMSPVRSASSVGTHYTESNTNLFIGLLFAGSILIVGMLLFCRQSNAPAGYSIFDNGAVYDNSHELIGCKQGYRAATGSLSTRQQRIQNKQTFEYCRIDN